MSLMCLWYGCAVWVQRVGGQLYLTLVVSQVPLSGTLDDQHHNTTPGLTVGLVLLLVGEQPAILEPPSQNRSHGTGVTQSGKRCDTN